jgi:hypothetical protein
MRGPPGRKRLRAPSRPDCAIRNIGCRLDLDQSPDRRLRPTILSTIQGAKPMPTEMIVISAIVAAFGLFAATLFWADLQTRELGK